MPQGDGNGHDRRKAPVVTSSPKPKRVSAGPPRQPSTPAPHAPVPFKQKAISRQPTVKSSIPPPLTGPRTVRQNIQVPLPGQPGFVGFNDSDTEIMQPQEAEAQEAAGALLLTSPEFKRLVVKVETLASAHEISREQLETLDERLKQVERSVGELIRSTKAASSNPDNSVSEASGTLTKRIEKLEASSQASPRALEERIVHLEKVLLRLHGALGVLEKRERAYQPVGDDLTQLKGIGPKYARTLQRHGVTRVAEIAAWSAEDIEKQASLLGASIKQLKGWVAAAKQNANNHAQNRAIKSE